MKTRITLWFVMLFGGAALGLFLDRRRWRRWLLNPWWQALTLLTGVALLRLVMQSSRNTGRRLARYGREGDIPRMETNKLVTSGVYSCMRHPMHLGLLFFPLAVALILGSPTFILVIAPVEMALMIILIKTVEEPEAIAKFGDEYRDYMRRVPMFSLRLACLRQLLGETPPKMVEGETAV